MRQRRLGRTGWTIGEIGYGMWAVGGGPGGWTGTDDTVTMSALRTAVEMRTTFFDTAWIYGRGHSERVLARVIEQFSTSGLRIATKIPPRDRSFPSNRASRLEDVFPDDHVEEYVRRSLSNLGVETVDLLQYHVWEDTW